MNLSVSSVCTGCLWIAGLTRLTTKTVVDFELTVQSCFSVKLRQLVLDCSQVVRLDGAGLASLLLMQEQLEEAGVSFRVARPHRSMQQVLEFTRLDRHFEYHSESVFSAALGPI